MEEQLTQTVLNIDPQVFWGLVTLVTFALISLTVIVLPTKTQSPLETGLERMKKHLGLQKVNTSLFLIGASIWGVVFLLLAFGLIWLIWDVIWITIPDKTDNQAKIWDWRFSLVKLTALVATLGAVVALPITMQRLRLSRQQTTTTAEALFNDKINAAADDLHARRLVTKNPDEPENRWDYHQDDIVRRNAAIDRLEGLAIERPDIAPRIARMLSIYVRELSAENKAQVASNGASPEKLRHWAWSLSASRSDMENAAQTLGRLKKITGVEPDMVEIDLRGANLQGFDLRDASLTNARLNMAKMQGADL